MMIQNNHVVIFLLCFSVFIGISLQSATVKLGSAPPCIITRGCSGNDWKLKEGIVDPEKPVELVFALKTQNEAQLESLLYSVSEPTSPFYGQHLSFEELGTLISNPEAEAAVKEWLWKSGVEWSSVHTSLNKDFIIAQVPLRVAEAMLSTTFYNFHSASSGNVIQRALTYSVPEHLHQHLDFIGGTVQFPPFVKKHSMVAPKPLVFSVDEEVGSTAPALLNKYYNITMNTVTNLNSTQSLFESLGQSFSESDLKIFQKTYNLPDDPVTLVIGPNNPKACVIDPNQCVEANLDVQYIKAIAQLSPTTYWSVPSTAADIFLAWIIQIANATNPPLVHSISYGSIESESDVNLMKRFNVEAQKLGIRGITILVASGDDGVANFLARDNPKACGFEPSYPATVPFVTAVGATQGPETGSTEIMCSSSTYGLITSGGGFSRTFTTPDYQQQVVSNYLKTGPNMPPTALFNALGRGYPDVSLMGHNYLECLNGKFYQVSGTSASTPVLAGFITLINSALMSKGKPPLGFLNPLLYSLKSLVYHDITSGINNCCAGYPGQAVCCTYGFTSCQGWDPTTGLGSVDFSQLMQSVMAM